MIVRILFVFNTISELLARNQRFQFKENSKCANGKRKRGRVHRRAGGKMNEKINEIGKKFTLIGTNVENYMDQKLYKI